MPDTITKRNRDRNKRAQLRQRLKSLNNVENLAQSGGLRHDPTFMKKLGYLLQYGFQDQFEVRMNTGLYTFSANLKREYLREHEHLLIRKYSRLPDQPFVLFGTIAQRPSKPDNDEDGEENSEAADFQHLKEALMGMVGALSEVEPTFSGKLANEIIVDPIALYREI